MASGRYYYGSNAGQYRRTLEKSKNGILAVFTERVIAFGAAKELS